MQNLEGRIALVTGASAGIGAATTRALVRAGAQVVAAARREDRLQALREELGASVTPLVLDVRDASAVSDACRGKGIDLVVANAGLARGVGPIQSGDVDGWHDMIDTNVKGVLHIVRATLADMLDQGRGDVVLLGSIAGRQVYPGGNVYNATKHAVKALYEAMRLDAGAMGVRFTTIDPGMVETEFSEVRFDGDSERAAAVYQGFAPLQADDVADAILYAVTRPAHVNIGEIVLWPTDQASATIVRRDA